MGLLDAEGGVEGEGLLPTAWRSQCLRYGAMADMLAAAARGLPLPPHGGRPDAPPVPPLSRRPNAPPPALVPALQADERHRRFAELLVRELDAVYMFLADERGECCA